MMLDELYQLADNLQMSLVKSGKAITGERPIVVTFGDLVLKGHQKVIASYADKGATPGLVLVSTFGDLGAMLGVSGATTLCLLVDLSKLAERGTGIFAKAKPQVLAEAEALFEGAIVARFIRKKTRPWVADAKAA